MNTYIKYYLHNFRKQQIAFQLPETVLMKFTPVQTGVDRGSFACIDPCNASPNLAQGGFLHLGPFLRPYVNHRHKSINGEEFNAYIQSESATKH